MNDDGHVGKSLVAMWRMIFGILHLLGLLFLAFLVVAAIAIWLSLT